MPTPHNSGTLTANQLTVKAAWTDGPPHVSWASLLMVYRPLGLLLLFRGHRMLFCQRTHQLITDKTITSRPVRTISVIS